MGTNRAQSTKGLSCRQPRSEGTLVFSSFLTSRYFQCSRSAQGPCLCTHQSWGNTNHSLGAPGCGIQVKMCLCPPKTWHSLQVKPTQTQKGCSVTCFHLAAGSFLLRKRNFLHPFHRVKPNSWNTELNERGSWVCTESPAQSWSHTWLPAFFQSQGSPAPFLPLEKSV